jgi:tetratricopeptide (TPR) repeat protein
VAHHLGQQFGNYRLLRAVGSGSFATVYLGAHIHLGTQAALKVLHMDVPPDEGEAFRAEARTIARLVHPHIVRVLDFGLQGKTPFLVMDYAPYGSLRTDLSARLPLPLANVLPYVKQVAEALHYAHQQQVVHRDVKPENMLLGAQKQVLLADFGLAVIFASSRQHQSFDIAGTMAYMAPEQIRGKPCPASDQYALAVVLYQWLTGVLPFRGAPREILLQHLANQPPSLRAQGADICVAVEAVILQALAKEPGQRFPSIEAFLSALQQAAQDGGENTIAADLRRPLPRYAESVPWRRAPQHALVGRERELGLLRQLLQAVQEQKEAHRSEGQAPGRPYVSLTGDPGIGKTRLAEEIGQIALQQGWMVLWGRAHSHEQQMVYCVWIDLLRRALTYGHWPWQEVDASPERYRPLAALLPELASLLPPAPAARSENPELTPLRIWEAVLTFFAASCLHAPLLIVLDDIHWADDSSYRLLEYLVRNLADRRVLLLGTSRDQEISATHPLHTLCHHFQHQRTITTIVLSALSESQVGQLVAHLPPLLATDIQRRAAGNPFFAEELARFPRPAHVLAETELPSASLTQEGLLPASIVGIFEQRIAQLSQGTQKMLGYAAILGNAFSFDVLRLMQDGGTSAGQEEALLDQLDEVLEANLLLEERSGMQVRYHFWHPLLVNYLSIRLSAMRRVRLHGRAARALRELMKDQRETASAIVYHLVNSAAEPGLLVHYAQLAGEHAHTLSAYPEAEKQYRLALAQLGEVAPGASPEECRVFAHLFECLGECSMVEGKFEEARSFYERALALRDALLAPMGEEEQRYEAQIKALFYCEIGKTWHYLGKSSEAQQAYVHGERTLLEAGVVGGPAWAKIHFEEGYHYWRYGNFDQALRTAYEALQLFEHFLDQANHRAHPPFLTKVQSTLQGNPADLGRVYTLLAAIEATKGQVAQSLEHLHAALAIYRQHEHQQEIAFVCTNLADLYLRRSEYAQAQAMLQHAYAIAEKMGDLPNISIISINSGVLAARQGRVVDAEAWYRRALALAAQMKDLFCISLFHGYVAMALVDQGKLEQAKHLLVLALQISRAQRLAQCSAFALVVLAHLRIARARASRAEPEASHNWLGRARLSLQRALVYGKEEAETRIEGGLALAEVLLLSGSLDGAERQVRAVLSDVHTQGIVWLRLRALHLLGTLVTARGNRLEGNGLFQQAIEELQRQGMHLEYARALRNYGFVLLEDTSGGAVDRQQGRSYLARAWEIFLECDAGLDAEGVKAFLRSQGAMTAEGGA